MKRLISNPESYIAKTNFGFQNILARYTTAYAFILGMLLPLLQPQQAYSQAWRLYGDTLFNQPFHYTTPGASFMKDASGKLYYAYASTSDSANYLKTNGVGGWVDFAAPTYSSNYHYYAVKSGPVYRAKLKEGMYYYYDAQLAVEQYNGSSWIPVGGIIDTAYFYSADVAVREGSVILIDNSNAPVVYYIESDLSTGQRTTPKVKRFNGSSWVDVGTFTTTGSTYNFQVVCTAGGVFYASYYDGSGRSYVKKYDGTNWIDVGSVNVSAYSGRVAVDPAGVPYFVHAQSTYYPNPDTIHVRKFNGAAWIPVGAPLVDRFNRGAAFGQLYFDNNGVPYLPLNPLLVVKYNGSAWVDVASIYPTYNNYSDSVPVKLVFDNNNDVYAATTHYSGSNVSVGQVFKLKTTGLIVNALTDTICQGNGISLEAYAINNTGTVNYQWVGPGISCTSCDSIYVTPSVSTDYLLIAWDNVNRDTAQIRVVVVPAGTINASVYINASHGNTCPGTAVTFMASPFNEGPSPFYQWKKNGVNVGTNSTTYTDNTLTNSDTVWVVMTSNMACVTTPSVSSVKISVRFGPQTPSMTVSMYPTTFCAGTPVTFVANAYNVGSNPTFQWKKNGVDVGIDSSRYVDSALVTGDSVWVVMTSSLSCSSPAQLVSTKRGITVGGLTSSVSLYASATAICTGTKVTFQATTQNAGTAPVYQWKKNGVNVGTNSSIYVDSTLNHNDSIWVVVNVSNCALPATLTSTTKYITIGLTAIVSVGYSPANVCSGTAVTFTAYSSNGGTAPVYQWKKNGVNVGTNSSTYVDNTLNHNDSVWVVMTSSTCASPATVTSAKRIVPVGGLTASVLVYASDSSICAGDTVYFNAYPTNGGATPTYQWKKNGVNAGTNSNTYTGALNPQDSVWVVMTSSTCAVPATVISNKIIMASGGLNASVSITHNGSPICPGEAKTFTATPVNGGPSPVYQWKKNGVNVGTNANTYTDNTLTNQDTIWVVMTSSACGSAVATSNRIMVTVGPFTPVAYIMSSDTSICSNTYITFSAYPLYSGTAPVIQWKKNGVNVGTGGFTYAASVSPGDTVYYVFTSSFTCATPPTVTSNRIVMTTSPTCGTFVLISASQTSVCPGGSVTYTATPINGGTPSYQWVRNGVNVGTNSNVYTSGNLVSNDTVIVLMTGTFAGSPYAVASNSIRVTVASSLVPSVNVTFNTSSAICQGTPVTFTAVPVNGGNSPVYQWKKNGVNVGTNSSVYIDSTLTTQDSVWVVMTSSHSCASPATATGPKRAMTVGNLIPVGIVYGSDTSICPATQVTFSSYAFNIGTTPAYQWKKNGVNVGANAATYTGTVNPGDTIWYVLTSSLSCAVPTTVNSSKFVLTADTVCTAVSVTVAASQSTLCTAAGVTFTATPLNAGTPSYQWKKNGINVGTNASTYTTSALANGDSIWVEITGTVNSIPYNAVSNKIRMVIGTGSVTVSLNAIGTGCAGGTTLGLSNSSTANSIIWMQGSIPVDTIYGPQIDTTYAANVAGSYTAIANFGGSCTATSNAVNVGTATPVVTLNASATNICQGSTVTFTPSITNLTGIPAYEWRKNGVVVGSGPAYTSNSLSNGDQIWVVVSNPVSTCTPNSDTSNIITMAVAVGTGNIAITTNGSGCLGTSLNVSSASTANYIIWQRNGVNIDTVYNGGVTVAGGNGYGGAANQLYNPQGIHIDASGNLFIADASNHRIQKWAPGATSGVTVAGGNGGGSAANQLYNPSAVFVDASGNLFISEGSNNRVSKWAQGAASGISVAGGGSAVTSRIGYPKDVIVFGDTMYIAEFISVRRWIVGDTAGLLVAGSYVWNFGTGSQMYPNSVAADIYRNLYISDGNNNLIQKKIYNSTAYLNVAGNNGAGSAANQFDGPNNVFRTDNGDLYIADANNYRIQKWALNASTGTTVAGGNGAGSASNQFSLPYDVFVVGNYVYVSDRYNHRVQRWEMGAVYDTVFTPTTPGTYTAIVNTGNCNITTNSVTIGGAAPSATIAASVNNICQGSSVTFTSSVTNNTGTVTYQWNRNGQAVGTGTTYTSSNLNNGDQVSLIVTDATSLCATNSDTSNVITITVGAGTSNVNITAAGTGCANNTELSAGGVNGASQIVWNLNNTPVDTVFGSSPQFGISIAGGNGMGQADHELFYAIDFATDAAGNVYALDWYRVKKWAPGASSGVVVAGILGWGTAANAFDNPKGICLDNNGNIYVADNDNNRIQKWTPGATTGITVAGGNGPGSAANQFEGPSGVSVDAGGNIYVADNGNHRIQKWAPGATSGVTVAGGNGWGYAANQLVNPQRFFIDNANNIYACDVLNKSIVKWAPGATSGITVAGGNGRGSAANQFDDPTGVSVDASGNIFVSDRNNHRIQKWTPGATTGITVAGGNGQGTAANQLGSPNNVRLDAASNILIADHDNHRIQKWSSAANIDSTYTPTEPGSYTVVATFGTCSAASTPYVIDTCVNVLVAVSQNNVCSGSYVTFTASADNARGNPAYQWYHNGNPVGSNSAAYSGSSFNNADSVWVRLIDGTDTVYSNKIVMSVSAFQSPITLSASGSGCLGNTTLNLSDTTGVTQIVWNLDGVPVDTVYAAYSMGITVAGGTAAGSGPNQFAGGPSGMAIDAANNLYISDAGNHRVQKWAFGATSGTTVAGGNGQGVGANQFDVNIALCLDPQGNVYVTDNHNNRIQKWAPGASSGTTVAGMINGGSSAFQFQSPHDVVRDASGNLYIADANNSRIQKWAPGANSGTTVAGGNGQGSALNQTTLPFHICLDRFGNLYFSDRINNRVLKYVNGSTTGVVVAGGNGAGGAANQLNTPGPIYVDNNDALYVTDIGSGGDRRIQKWLPGATSGITVAGGNGAGSDDDQFWNCAGIALDSYGDLYISDPINNRIQKWPQTTRTSFTPTLAGTYTATLVTTSGCDAVTNPIVISGSVASVSITASQTSICAGENVVFTATPVSGGSAPAYQWYKNGNTTGTNSTTYADNTLNDNDEVWVRLTSNASCVTAPVVNSNHVVMTVGIIRDTLSATIQQGQNYYGHVLSGIYTDTFTASGGCDSIRTLYLTVLNSDTIWPGDANSDGVANMYDALSLGLAYGDTGPVRPGANNTWTGQLCPPWTNSYATGVNHNHGDCDGNGTIDANDTIPVLLNYGLTHSKGAPPVPGGVPLYLQITNAPVLSGDTAKFNIMLGDSVIPATNIYGIAFSIEYDETEVVSNSFRQQFVNSWLGQVNGNLLTLTKPLPLESRIDQAVCRIDHLNTSGAGVIGQVSVITIDNISGKDTVHSSMVLKFANVKAIDNLGLDVAIDAKDDTLATYRLVDGIDVPGAQLQVAVFPNPSSGSVKVVSGSAITSCRLFNVQGLEVLIQEEVNALETTIDMQDLVRGVYLLETTCGNQRVMKRVVLVD